MLPLTVSELERNDHDQLRWATALPNALQALLNIELQHLQPLESVTRQFEERGILFADAIALIPSNPRFIAHSGQRVLMPMHSNNTLKVTLQSIVQRLSLWGRGTQPIVLQAWDEADNLVTEQTAEVAQSTLTHETMLLPCQMLKLSTVSISHIVLSSMAPFTLEGIAL